MARLAVINAVEARLAATWSRSSIVGMVHKDQRLDESASFVAVQYPVANNTRISVGDRRYQEEGGIRFVLQMTREESPEVMMQWADELADLFRDQTFEGVRCLQPTSPFIDSNNDNGNFFTLSFVVPYVHEYQG